MPHKRFFYVKCRQFQFSSIYQGNESDIWLSLAKCVLVDGRGLLPFDGEDSSLQHRQDGLVVCFTLQLYEIVDGCLYKRLMKWYKMAGLQESEFEDKRSR